MQQDEQEDTAIYRVVVNHEEQYSIWPSVSEIPLGWKEVGKSGAKAECLAHIEAVWTDMRPLSLRRQMEELARSPQPAPVAEAVDAADDLIPRLCAGSHPVQIALRTEKTAAQFKAGIDRGFVHVCFTGTRGGTELGIRLDKEACDLGRANFADGTGMARLVGGVTLNFVKVRCVAEVDLSTLSGQGHLEVVQN